MEEPEDNFEEPAEAELQEAAMTAETTFEDPGEEEDSEEGSEREPAELESSSDEIEWPGDTIAEEPADSTGEMAAAPRRPDAPPVPDPYPEARPHPETDLVRDIEAVLFVSPEPVSLEVLAEVTGAAGEELARAVEEVKSRHSGGGIAFAEVAGGYTFRAGDAARGAVERFCARPVDYSLSAAAMETLAIIAYLQPITRPEIARIRGVGADSVVTNLMDKGLVEEAGRHPHSGAVRYRTADSFEKLFGLVAVEDLPSLDGFEATPGDVEELRQKLYTAAEKRE